MSTATLTKITASTDAVTDTATLRSLIASIDAGTKATDAAEATMAETVMALVLGTVGPRHTDNGILTKTGKASVTALAWLAATGDPVPVPAEDRKDRKGIKSFALYLSRYLSLAATPGHGIAALTSPADVVATKKAIAEKDKADKAAHDEHLAVTEGRAAHAAWVEFKATLSQPRRDALTIVEKLFASDGAPHKVAFINVLAAQGI